MKKLLAFILAAALALSLVACGGGGGTGDTNTPSNGNGDTTGTDTPSGGGDSTPEETSNSDGQVFHLGDTVTIDDLELTFTRIEYGEILDNTVSTNSIRNENYLLPLPDDEIGRYEALKQYTPGTATYEASDGHILVAFSIEVKSNSKTAVDINYIFERFDIDYNNGYLFENSKLSVGIDNSWESVGGFLDAEIEPLDSTVYEFRGYAEVPEEVINNTDNSLNLNVYLDEHIHGRTTPDLIFNIR